MNNKIKMLELFSGMGGFSKGFLDAGFTITDHYFSEINKHAIANYKYNFKNAKHIGSVVDFRGQRNQADVITFGSPCQDFSLAGSRKGLQGNQSSLISQAIRIVSEVRPAVFFWENVKGTFSSNDGADFWAILQAFANIGGYRLEWQLLNTKWFLPQNRERIYLVGHLDGKSEPGIFPFGAKTEMVVRRSSEKQVASCIQGAGGNVSKGEYKGMNLIEVGTLRTYFDDRGFRKSKDSISPTIPSRGNRDGSGQPVIKVHNLQPRSGDPKKGGTGPLQKINEAYCLDTVHSNGIECPYGIRRLTEIECERLQGYPDDWTKYGDYDGVVKLIPMTQRYRLIGNAVTVKVVQEQAQKLKLVIN